jgi:hypothetical protein
VGKVGAQPGASSGDQRDLSIETEGIGHVILNPALEPCGQAHLQMVAIAQRLVDATFALDQRRIERVGTEQGIQ